MLACSDEQVRILKSTLKKDAESFRQIVHKEYTQEVLPLLESYGDEAHLLNNAILRLISWIQSPYCCLPTVSEWLYKLALEPHWQQQLIRGQSEAESNLSKLYEPLLTTFFTQRDNLRQDAFNQLLEATMSSWFTRLRFAGKVKSANESIQGIVELAHDQVDVWLYRNGAETVRQRAASRLVNRLERKLTASIYQAVRHWNWPELDIILIDLVQDTFTDFFRRLDEPTFQLVASAWSFIFGMAERKTKAKYRQLFNSPSDSAIPADYEKKWFDENSFTEVVQAEKERVYTFIAESLQNLKGKNCKDIILASNGLTTLEWEAELQGLTIDRASRRYSMKELAERFQYSEKFVRNKDYRCMEELIEKVFALCEKNNVLYYLL